MHLRALVTTLVLSATLFAACEDDGGAVPIDAATSSDAGTGTGSETSSAGEAGTMAGGDARDSASATADASAADAPAGDAGTQTAAQRRGEYLVKTVINCGGCHTPQNAMGQPDSARFLGGRTCFIDSALPNDNGMGCLHTSNLTNHETGLRNRTDAEIKDLLTKGLRPGGQILFSNMPYYLYHALDAADVDAIVAYLRTVPGINNMVPAHEAPNWSTRPTAALAGITPQDLPAISAMATDQASATRGRSLATVLCVACHSPTQMATGMVPIKLNQAFEGGREYMNQTIAGAMRSVYSTNLTPHASGTMGWTVADIIKVLKEGKDRAGKGVCPPMPSGAMSTYGNMDMADLTDIANYVLSIPGKNNAIPMACELP